MSDHVEYVPITTEDAVEAVLNGAWLYRAEIPDFRAMIEGVQNEAKKRGRDPGEIVLRLLSCRILECQCSGLCVAVRLDMMTQCYGSDGYVPVEMPATAFEADACFQQATFAQNAVFEGARFAQKADFWRATFTRRVLFTHAVFTQEAVFWRATFAQDAYFGGATFTEDANFWEATFAQDADFANANVEQCLLFRGARPSGRLRLSKTRFGSEARLSFEDIDLRPGGRIELTIDQIGRRGRRLIEQEASEHKTLLGSAAAQYNILRDNFRALPSTDEEEDRCHYKYMDLRRRASDWRAVRRLFDWLVLKWCWGYGIYTHRIAASMLVVIFVCGLVYHISGGPSTIKNYYVPASPDILAAEADATGVPETDFNPLYFSVITFTTIGYGDYAPLGWLRAVAGAEGVIGLFLMALLTVSFARKFIR